VKSEVNSMLLIFFDITNNSSWQAKQSIPHTTVTFHGDCVKMCEDLAPKFGEKSSYCITIKHRLGLPPSAGNFLPRTTT
jgi:hypothetical protein